MLASDKINLEKMQVMLVDDNQQGLDIMGQIVAGFGARNQFKCANVKDAKDLLRKTAVDLVLTDAQIPDEDGYSLVRWIRTEGPEMNRYVPILIVTGHTRRSDIFRGRDSGANFVVAKPVTPRALLERIFWVGRDERKFIECDSYVGPDRRFKREGPPAGMEGRREDDLHGQLGDASEPNLSQDEINAMMRPAKVAV
ncbi:MAG: response regulator [Proteobacteria bacterium]|nr:response regulator [Pseudomonadota bacterium]